MEFFVDAQGRTYVTVECYDCGCTVKIIAGSGVQLTDVAFHEVYRGPIKYKFEGYTRNGKKNFSKTQQKHFVCGLC